MGHGVGSAGSFTAGSLLCAILTAGMVSGLVPAGAPSGHCREPGQGDGAHAREVGRIHGHDSAYHPFAPLLRGVPADARTEGDRVGTWDHPAGRSRSRSRERKRAIRLYRSAIRIIRNSYVTGPPKREIYEGALHNVGFTLLPECDSLVGSMEDCSGRGQDCFLDALLHVSSICSYGPQYLVKSGLSCLLRELGPHCQLMDADMLRELEVSTSGIFGGIGMVVAPRDGQYRVVSALAGSPAQEAGIRPGDRILAIDNAPIEGKSLIEVLGKVRGESGSRIHLTVKDRISGEVRSVTLVRRRIQIPPVRARMLDPGTGYLRIVNFQQSTAREVRQALGTVMPKGPAQLKGLIIDLRNNPGGLFDQAIDVADILLSSGRITLLRSQDRRFNRTFNASGRGLVPGLPVVVLINRGTASAAEILAGALQGKPRVLIMGQRSFGKASVQAVYHLRDGLALRITTAHYFTAEGHDINRRGIHPDQVLREPDETDITTGQTYSTLDDSVRIDPEVHAALEYLGLR